MINIRTIIYLLFFKELARLLQEQDLKRRGDLLQEDQLVAIEAQDRELAKVLQEQVETCSPTFSQ